QKRPKRGRAIFLAGASISSHREHAGSTGDHLAHDLAPTVLDWQHFQIAEVAVELCEERMRGRPERTTGAVFALERDADAVAGLPRGTRWPWCRSPALRQPRARQRASMPACFPEQL